MVADSGLGWAYPIAINLTDQNGSPLSGAVTGGALSLYGPASATSTVHTGTVAEIANGDYGLTVPSTVNVVEGYYTWAIPTMTVGGITFTNQTGGYSVGLIPPEYRTLRAIVVAVCEALGVGILSRTDSEGTASTLIDSRWVDAGMATNELVGDEVLIFEQEAATDKNPVRVTASNHTTGTLTLAPSVSDVDSGTDYLLIRPGKRGLRYAQIIEAIVAAVADIATRQKVTDEVTLMTGEQQRYYTLPNSWLNVTSVAYNPWLDDTEDPYWEELGQIYWDYHADRRRLYLKPLLGNAYQMRVTGTVGVPEPRSLGGLVKVPWTLARDTAVGYLSVPIEQRAGLAYRRATAAAGRRLA